RHKENRERCANCDSGFHPTTHGSWLVTTKSWLTKDPDQDRKYEQRRQIAFQTLAKPIRRLDVKRLADAPRAFRACDVKPDGETGVPGLIPRFEWGCVL